MEPLRRDPSIPELIEHPGFALCLQGALQSDGGEAINLMGEASHPWTRGIDGKVNMDGLRFREKGKQNLADCIFFGKEEPGTKEGRRKGGCLRGLGEGQSTRGVMTLS